MKCIPNFEFTVITCSRMPKRQWIICMSFCCKETLKDHPRLVWMDASIRFKKTGNFSHIKSQILQTDGILQMVSVRHTIFEATHKQLYEYFPLIWRKSKGLVSTTILLSLRMCCTCALISASISNTSKPFHDLQ